MISANRGWGHEQVKRGEKAVKMVTHVLLHTWKSKEDELRYKGKEDGEYESIFLRPVRGAAALGLEYEEEQVLLEPIDGGAAKEEKSSCGLMGAAGLAGIYIRLTNFFKQANDGV